MNATMEQTETTPAPAWQIAEPRVVDFVGRTHVQLDIQQTARSPRPGQDLGRDLPDLVRPRLAESEAIGRYRHLGGKLTAAEREIAALQRQRDRLELDRADVVERLSGEELAAALASSAREAEALDERLILGQEGLAVLRERVRDTRAAAEQELGRITREAAAGMLAGWRERAAELREVILEKIAGDVEELAGLVNALALQRADGFGYHTAGLLDE